MIKIETKLKMKHLKTKMYVKVKYCLPVKNAFD